MTGGSLGRSLGALLWLVLVACGGDDGGGEGPDWVRDVRLAVDAVEDELGTEVELFEVTATPALTNVFVAVDDATAAVPYVFVDGDLEDPAPPLPASGSTFTAAAIAFDEDRVLATVADELPGATVDAFSVEGGPGGSVRYIASVRSEAGGVLDVVVGADGAVLSVNPL